MLLAVAAAGAAAAYASWPAATDAVPHAPASPTADTLATAGATFARIEWRANAEVRSRQAPTDLALDERGQVIVCWQSRRQEQGRVGAMYRRFDQAGRPLGPERRMPRVGGFHYRAPALAKSATGLWGAFEAFGRDGDGRGVYLRRLDDATASATLLADRTAGAQRAIALAPAADGVIAVWLGPDDAGVDRLWRRQLAADGSRLGPTVAIATGGDPAPSSPTLAAQPSGASLVAWVEPLANQTRLRARRFDPAGQPGAAFVLAEPGHLDVEPCVALGHDGRAVATWLRRAPETGGYHVFARAFAADGTPRGPATRLSRGAGMGGGCSGATVAVAADGRACVAWNERRSARDRPTVVARWLRRNGEPLGGPFAPLRARGAPQALPVGTGRRCVQFGADDTLVFAWHGDAGRGDPSGAHVTLLRPVGPGADPTPEQPHTDAARPHDPPTRRLRPDAARLPFGGDAQPTGSAEFGFPAITDTGWDPPDAHLAVGPNHLVAIANGEIAFTGLDGTRTFAVPIEGGFGFWGALGATSFVFDPEVVFDATSQRFVAAAAESTQTQSWFVVAVSDDADPNGTWHKYRINVTSLGGGADIDSPNLAVDGQAVYLAADFFNTGDKHLVVALDKAPLLAGQPVGTQRSLVVQGTQSFGLPMSYSPAPAQYLLEHSEARSSNVLRLHAITDPLGSPTRVTADLAVFIYTPPVPVPRQGTSTLIDLFEARFWSCMWRDGSLWAAHHQGDPARVRWYEIKTNGWPTSGMAPTLAQTGTIDRGLNVHTFFPAIGADAGGNVVLCYARSSSQEPVSIERTCRLDSDPLGSMRPPVNVKTSAGRTLSYRWGDYGQVVPDPMQPCRLWYSHEYAPTVGSWNTWIGRADICELAAAPRGLVAMQGGSVGLSLMRTAGAGRPYIVLGSLSGTMPGVTLPPSLGGASIPLNFDAFTRVALGAVTSPPLIGFVGNLDAAGLGRATFSLPPISFTGSATFSFAFLQDGTTWDFASNPVNVRLNP
ncbi:MAG: hypothetical protein AAF628_31435 [Planctomycetota bacterium]